MVVVRGYRIFGKEHALSQILFRDMSNEHALCKIPNRDFGNEYAVDLNTHRDSAPRTCAKYNSQ